MISKSILEDVERWKKSGGLHNTQDGIGFLHLENKPENYFAANTYLLAIEAIVELQKELRTYKRAHSVEPQC